MKKRLLTLLLATTVACSLFAGCGSKKDDSKKSDKKTTVEKTTDDTDDEDDDDSTSSNSGMFDTVEDYINEPAIKKQLDSAVSSMSTDGMTIKMEADEDTLYYIYQSGDQLVGTEACPTLDDAKAVFDPIMSQLESQMVNVANSLKPYVNQDTIKVVVRYLDADGTVIAEGEFLSE